MAGHHGSAGRGKGGHEQRRRTHPGPELFPGRRPTRPRRPPEKHDPPPAGEWNKAIDEFLEERERGRKRDPERDERRKTMPRPWLRCASDFRPQIAQFEQDEDGIVHFEVWNEGNAPAWTCHVELYEGPYGWHRPLADFDLRGQEIITLQPGEHRTVPLTWVRRRSLFSRIVGIVYDPLLDPMGFTIVEKHDRHTTSGYWPGITA